MVSTSPTKLLAALDAEQSRYESFASKLSSLIEEIFKEHGRAVHSVTARIKSKDSFVRKISGSDKEYALLSDVTDICGIRIITYFQDDVDAVAELIASEFSVDLENSIDKRAALDPDRFGYLSLHLIASLPLERARLIEYKRFQGLKAEIQIRSILQHAWAEIEHDLGYKTKLGVPKEIRRKFSRLAGLLEVADQEFSRIRDDLKTYEQVIPERIENNPQAVDIDKASLEVFIANSGTVSAIDYEIAAASGADLTSEFPNYIVEASVARFHWLGIKTIGDLEKLLIVNRELISKIAYHWLRETPMASLVKGASLLYLFYSLAVQRCSQKELDSALVEFGLAGLTGENARKLREVYSKIEPGR